MGTRYEYKEVDLHGDSGLQVAMPDSPLGDGMGGWVAKLNAYARKDWRCIWIDRDTTVRVIAILEREVPDATSKEKGDG